MKRIIFLTAALSALVSLSSCTKDDNDKSNNNNGLEDIVVSVDSDGQVQGGHSFNRIDKNNFYIDGLRYTYTGESLYVNGSDPLLFNGTAKVIATLNYGGQTWNVTSIGILRNKNLTSIYIPNTVTSIGAEAFYGCIKLETVTMGRGMRKIWSDAFKNCLNLKDVYCYATTPPNCSNDFRELPQFTVHVPAESVNAYLKSESWKNFPIVPID